MRYFYEDCVTGEIYVSDKYLNEDELYCKECDDWDNFLGAVENGGDLLDLIAMLYESGYLYDDIKTVVNEEYPWLHMNFPSPPREYIADCITTPFDRDLLMLGRLSSDLEIYREEKDFVYELFASNDSSLRTIILD